MNKMKGYTRQIINSQNYIYKISAGDTLNPICVLRWDPTFYGEPKTYIHLYNKHRLQLACCYDVLQR